MEPKFRPERVIDERPLMGMLPPGAAVAETTGASNENGKEAVPTMPLMVTAMALPWARLATMKLVLEIHWMMFGPGAYSGWPAWRTDREKSTEPKLMPETPTFGAARSASHVSPGRKRLVSAMTGFGAKSVTKGGS